MARTQILPSDPGAVKVYSASVAVDVAKKSYFNSKMAGTETQKLPVLVKTDLESGAGDEVTCYLVAKLRGRPAQGAEKLEGREMRLSKYTDKLRVDKFRNGVNVGDVMDQKRVKWSIKSQARDRLSDYIAEFEDEMTMMHAAGARGVGAEIQHFPADWTAGPDGFVAPDAGHQTYPGAVASKGGLTNEKLSLADIDKLAAKAKKFLGTEANGAKMTPITIEGGVHFLLLTGVEGMYDIRREAGDQGWLAIQKAAAAAEGRKNPIFDGSAGMYNKVILQEHEGVIKFNDYGAGSVKAMRSLFLGAHAVSKAYGFKGNGGVRYKLSESGLDLDEEAVIHFRTILGIKASTFNGQRFGMIAHDHCYTEIN